MDIFHKIRFKDFLEEAKKEKKELEECYKEAKRQTAERTKQKNRDIKTVSEELQEELEPIE